MSSTRQALVFSFLDRYAGLVVHTVSAMVIARLLTPAEIGVYSVVMVLLGFVAVFRDFGAGQYLVQHREASAEVMRVTFTMQFGLGALFALGVFAASWPVARFYGDARMVVLMHVLALNFLTTPFMAFPNALLVREMRFHTIAAIRLISGLGHASVAIGLAYGGFGPISLAWGNLAATLIGIGATAVLTRLPLWQWPTTRRLREVAGFGGGLTLVSLLGSLQAGAPELLLGKLRSLTEAGLMSRAQGLVTMFQQLVLNAVGSVALPYFSREARAGRDLGQPFVRASELVLGLGWAFLGVLALLAFPVVRVLYGVQWDEAVLPVRWLAVATAVALPGGTVCFSPLVAVGALGDAVRASVAAAALAVAAAAVGAMDGVVAAAQWQVVAAVPATAYWLWLVKRRVAGLRWRALAASAGRSAAIAAAAMAAPLGVVLLLGWRPAGHPLMALSCLPVAGLMLALAARATRHALWIELEHVLPTIGQRLRWRN